MRILFLTDNFPPETNAPANRTFDHARLWAAAGHDVTVVTGAPNFPRGRVFEGYRNRPYQTETIDGIRVVRVWTYIAANVGTVKRILDYVSFMTTGFLAALVQPRPDVIVATSPQFFTAIAGFLASLARRRPWVFEIRDLWPESIKAVDAIDVPWIIAPLERLARFLYRRADLLVPVTHAFRDHLLDVGVPESRVEVVTNGIDPDTVPAPGDRLEVRRRFGIPDEAFVSAYIGTIGMAHGVTTLVRAAARTADDPGFHWVAMGEGAKKAEVVREVEARGLTNVTVLDGRPRAEAFALLGAVDVSLVMLRDTPLFRTVIPSKIFESMALAKPIALGVRGESRRIVVDEAGCGLAFEPENDAELVDVVRRMRDDPGLAARLGASGRATLEASYTRSKLARRMLDALARVSPR